MLTAIAWTVGAVVAMSIGFSLWLLAAELRAPPEPSRNYIGIRAHKETWIVIYDDEYAHGAMAVVRRWAECPELSLTESDAEMIEGRISQEIKR